MSPQTCLETGKSPAATDPGARARAFLPSAGAAGRTPASRQGTGVRSVFPPTQPLPAFGQSLAPTLKAVVWTAWIVAALTPAVARAQSPGLLNILPTYRAGDTNRPSPVQAPVETSYTGPGRAEFLGMKSGHSDAFQAGINLFTPVPLNDRWIIPLGLASQNILLDPVAGAPVPERINTLSLTTGVGHRFNDDWMILGMFSTTLYQFNGVDGGDLGFSGGVSAMWRYRPSLVFRLGLMISPDSDLRVVPLVGAEWHIHDHWDLRLMLPQPRLVYQPDRHWSFHLGGNMVGTTFRTGETFGSSIQQSPYNDALGTYRDIRVGGGVGYRFNRMLQVEAEAGHSVSRQIDYTRVGETLRFSPAPYVRLGLNLGF